jgi:ubiquinone/menaquinone biosynthesis C-methylase UbiE
LQDRLLTEVFRVLKPGGVFAGTDSMQSMLMRLIHLHDTMVLVDPTEMQSRLESAGFSGASVEIGNGRFRFFSYKPVI